MTYLILITVVILQNQLVLSSINQCYPCTQVNTICWNDRGTTILSGSDDLHLVVASPFTGQVVTRCSGVLLLNFIQYSFFINSPVYKLIWKNNFLHGAHFMQMQSFWVLWIFIWYRGEVFAMVFNSHNCMCMNIATFRSQQKCLIFQYVW